MPDFLVFNIVTDYPNLSNAFTSLLQSDNNNNFVLTGLPFRPIMILGGNIFGYCFNKQQYCFTNDLQTFFYVDNFSDYVNHNIVDQIVVADKMYLLVKENPNDFKYYTGSIYSSKDLTKWIKEFSFDFPAMPSTIEFLNGSFYIGLSSNYDRKSNTYVDDEAGSIWKINVSPISGHGRIH